MKLGLMSDDLIPANELKALGFEAVQMFFAGPEKGDSGDPSVEEIDKVLRAGDMALAAMTLHIDLVNQQGSIQAEIDRAIRCVEKTAALNGRFGLNEKPIMIWHPSGYPMGSDINDEVIFKGLCEALGAVCHTAEQQNVHIAVEITRAGSVGSAETYLRIKDHVQSSALRVCMDAANFTPDRTPLERAVRMLADDTVIVHAKDSAFADNGEVADYGPVGSGKLDYPTYIQAIQKYVNAPYFIFEYYRSREDLLKARDIVKSCL